MNARRRLLLDARSRRGIPAREVAYLTRMTEAMVSKIENGHSPVTDETIGRYLRAELISDEEASTALRAAKDAA